MGSEMCIRDRAGDPSVAALCVRDQGFSACCKLCRISRSWRSRSHAERRPKHRERRHAALIAAIVCCIWQDRTRIGPSVKDSAIAASCDEPLAAGRVGRTPREGSTHLVPAATVTTGAKPHVQQQLARNLEVERALMGQRCRPQSFSEVQRRYPLFFVPHTWYSVLL